MKNKAISIFLSVALALLFLSPAASAQNFVFQDALGVDLSAASTTAAKATIGSSATIFLDITTLTLPDGDDEVDFYIQTTYDDGTTWVDLRNFHFETADDGSTAAIIDRITPDIDGPGDMRTFSGADPGIGAEISQTVPANNIWRLWGIYATMVTDAGVANRRVTVLIDDGTDTLFTASSAAVQTASNTETYTIGPHATVTDNHWIPTPTGMLMLEGWRVLTSTAAIEAGDNWSAPQFTVEAWGDPKAPTDGTLGDGLKVYRPMGSQIRIKVLITGATVPTYAFTARGVFR